VGIKEATVVNVVGSHTPNRIEIRPFNFLVTLWQIIWLWGQFWIVLHS